MGHKGYEDREGGAGCVAVDRSADVVRTDYDDLQLLVPQGGYDGASNLLNYSDSVNGAWSMQYDNLNRLQKAIGSGGVYNGLTLQWGYDSFGNRTSQTPSGSNVSAPTAISVTYNANNQIQTSSIPGLSTPPGEQPTYYDAAGNLMFDGQKLLQAYSKSPPDCSRVSSSW